MKQSQALEPRCANRSHGTDCGGALSGPRRGGPVKQEIPVEESREARRISHTEDTPVISVLGRPRRRGILTKGQPQLQRCSRPAQGAEKLTPLPPTRQ